jgi:hypothetical protein
VSTSRIVPGKRGATVELQRQPYCAASTHLKRGQTAAVLIISAVYIGGSAALFYVLSQAD